MIRNQIHGSMDRRIKFIFISNHIFCHELKNMRKLKRH